MFKLILITSILLSNLVYGLTTVTTPILSSASAAVTQTSPAVNMNQLIYCSIQVVFTGTPVGSLKVQISDDLTNTPGSVVNWTDFVGSTQAISAAGSFVYTMTASGYKWIRVVYTATSGTGTVSAIYNGKGN